jgi:hypothetical protein
MGHSRASLDQVGGFTPTRSYQLEALKGVPHDAPARWVAVADGGAQTSSPSFDQRNFVRTTVRQMGVLCGRTYVCVVSSGVGEWEPESPASRYSTTLLCRCLSQRLTGVGVIPEYQPCRSTSWRGDGCVSSILTNLSRLPRSLFLGSARRVPRLVATPPKQRIQVRTRTPFAIVSRVQPLARSHSRRLLTGSCGRRTGGAATNVATVAGARTACRCPRGGC